MRFEREFWQAVVHYGSDGSVAPQSLISLLQRFTALNSEEPVLSDVTWEVPALMGQQGFQLLVSENSEVSSVLPDLLLGRSASGWQISLSARQLMVRQHVRVDQGKRATAREDLVDQETFDRIVSKAVARVPTELRARRFEIAANYAAFTGKNFPPSVVHALLTGDESEICARPPQDGKRFSGGAGYLEFRTIGRSRIVLNDGFRAGNWFSEDGTLLNNAAVAAAVSIKTAAPEPETPGVAATALESMPVLVAEDIDAFFSELGIRALIERLRSLVPSWLEVDDAQHAS